MTAAPVKKERWPLALALGLFALSATFGLGLALSQARKSTVTLVNEDPAVGLTEVTLEVKGHVYPIGELRVRQVKQVAVEPEGESSMTLRYTRDGKKETWSGGYVEASGYRVAIGIGPSGVRESTALWPKKPQGF